MLNELRELFGLGELTAGFRMSIQRKRNGQWDTVWSWTHRTWDYSSRSSSPYQPLHGRTSWIPLSKPLSNPRSREEIANHVKGRRADNLERV